MKSVPEKTALVSHARGRGRRLAVSGERRLKSRFSVCEQDPPRRSRPPRCRPQSCASVYSPCRTPVPRNDRGFHESPQHPTAKPPVGGHGTKHSNGRPSTAGEKAPVPPVVGIGSVFPSMCFAPSVSLNGFLPSAQQAAPRPGCFLGSSPGLSEEGGPPPRAGPPSSTRQINLDGPAQAGKLEGPQAGRRPAKADEGQGGECPRGEGGEPSRRREE
jgi:hypothetical protein